MRICFHAGASVPEASLLSPLAAPPRCPDAPQGAHSLVCSATYFTPGSERRMQAQAFNFSAANPLVVRTKVGRACRRGGVGGVGGAYADRLFSASTAPTSSPMR